MDLTPEALRSARFREKLRGYHPDDVDAFLESVAEGLGVLLQRLRDSTERVRRAESGGAAAEAEESVRRTLVLAQRTADLAIAEAREEAAKLVAEAEARAVAITTQAQDAALATAEQAQEQLRVDLERLQVARDQLSADVKALEQWLVGERKRLKHALRELADRADAVRSGEGAPEPHTVDIPARPTRPPVATAAPRSPRPEPEPMPAPSPERTDHGRSTDRPAARTFTPSPPPEPAPVLRPPRVAAEEPSPAPPAPPPPPPWVAARGDDDVAPPPRAPRADAPRSGGDSGVDPDLAVLQRAQSAPAPEPPMEADDPYFAELRRAITDPQPLGPRDDDEPPPGDTGEHGSVEDIFEARRSHRLRRRR